MADPVVPNDVFTPASATAQEDVFTPGLALASPAGVFSSVPLQLKRDYFTGELAEVYWHTWGHDDLSFDTLTGLGLTFNDLS